MRRRQNNGFIEVIYGPMYSGKSDELISRIKAYGFAGEKYMVFSPDTDTRDEPDKVSSRTGSTINAIKINSRKPEEILKFITKDVRAIGVDEGQFFSIGLADVLERIADSGIDVYVAGLNLDFQRRPFETMQAIMPIAEFATSKLAVCFNCGANAAFSTRINSKPNDSTFEIGSEQYQAHCRKCWNQFNKKLINN